MRVVPGAGPEPYPDACQMTEACPASGEIREIPRAKMLLAALLSAFSVWPQATHENFARVCRLSELTQWQLEHS